ncbi:hypothetical protein ACLOJK_037280, partial [Asimina triloba]
MAALLASHATADDPSLSNPCHPMIDEPTPPDQQPHTSSATRRRRDANSKTATISAVLPSPSTVSNKLQRPPARSAPLHLSQRRVASSHHSLDSTGSIQPSPTPSSRMPSVHKSSRPSRGPLTRQPSAPSNSGNNSPWQAIERDIHSFNPLKIHPSEAARGQELREKLR